MISLVDNHLAPWLWLLALWSLRWGILLVALAAWFWWCAPRSAAIRYFAARSLLLAGLALPLVPQFWGPSTWQEKSPSTFQQSPSAVQQSAMSSVETPASPRPRLPAWKPWDQQPNAGQPMKTNLADQASTPVRVGVQPPLGLARICVLLLATLWLVGVAGSLGRLLLGRIWLFRFLQSATQLPDTAQRELQQCCRELRIRRAIEVQLHTDAAAPMLIGGRKARILVPPYWSELEPVAQRAILLHELAHLQRRDDLSKLTEETIRAFFWFHPLVHWLLRRIGSDREVLCDLIVVHHGTPPLALAGVLLECCRRAGLRRVGLVEPAMMLPFFRRQSVKDRIHFLMEEQKMSQWTLRPSRISVLVGWLILCGTIALIGGFGTRASEPAPPTNSREPATFDESAELPTFSAIQAAYRENFQRLRPLQVIYRITSAEGAGDIELDKWRLRGKEMMLEAVPADLRIEGREPDPDERVWLEYHLAQLPIDVIRLKETLAPEMVERRLATRAVERGAFWTDGAAFHARWARKPEDKESSLFPGPLTPPENLTELYRDITLASWSPQNQLPLRCWFGSQGAIGDQSLGQFISHRSMPLLGFVRTQWIDAEGWHDLDRFMSGECSEYEVVRWIDLDGRAMVLLDGYSKKSEGTGNRERQRAWIDPRRGHLPLRWERTFVDAHGKELGTALQVIEILEIEQLAQSYYPKAIKQQEFVWDPRQEVAKEAGAARPVKPRLPGRTTTWTFDEVNQGRAIDPAALALEFPRGARYRNGIDDRMYVAGTETPVPRPPRPTERGERAPDWEFARWADGTSRSLDDFRDHVILLVFSPDEPWDEGLVSVLEDVAAHYSDKPVTIILVHKPGTEFGTLEQIDRDGGSPILTAIDGGEDPRHGQTAGRFGVSQGTAVVIDRRGHVSFNSDTIEEEMGEFIMWRAARAASIPWPLKESDSEEEMLQQGMRLQSFILREAIDEAFAQPGAGTD